MKTILSIFASILLWSTASSQSNMLVGIATADITPETPIWLSGYAVRQKPSAGVIQPLHAKALAINDGVLGSAARDLLPAYEDDHLIGHHTWSYLLQNYNLLAGRIWPLFLLALLLLPIVWFIIRQ